ncbi:hypothetical protein FGO68_gene17725 [Halteria grandinella]|uniref:Peptidase A1 domain-containing protein n=1 Tax=Halteria grandinella TaxID=5974 RepID=A0A8J8NFB9_HALGN|nr:hypothetical protein FGO68_gene17725 [Halteria grandinella]
MSYLLLTIFSFILQAFSQESSVILDTGSTSTLYGCSELGDLQMPDYCQGNLFEVQFVACRGLYAGCKRCSVILALPPYLIDTYQCLGCDEGMYLYGYITASIVQNGGSGTKSRSLQTTPSNDSNPGQGNHTGPPGRHLQKYPLPHQFFLGQIQPQAAV